MLSGYENCRIFQTDYKGFPELFVLCKHINIVPKSPECWRCCKRPVKKAHDQRQNQGTDCKYKESDNPRHNKQIRCGRLQEFSLLHFSSLLFIDAGIINCSGAGLFVCYYCASAASFKTSFTSMYELGLKICSNDKLRFSEISDQSSIRKLAGVCPSLCSSIS